MMETLIEKFEALLAIAVTVLQNQLRSGKTYSGSEFEVAVCDALKQSKEKVSYVGNILPTGKHAFPDILVCPYIGVEVKISSSAKPTSFGNSIFETTRTSGIKYLYLVMAWDTIGEPKVGWSKYDQCMSNIVVDHSPRYRIDLGIEPNQNVFAKMDISYEDFIALNNEAKMKHVRKLYKSSAGLNDNLWWLNNNLPKTYFRFFKDLDKLEKNEFIGECLFLFPEIFGNDNKTKYSNLGLYSLSKGIINHNWRDVFSSGGTVEFSGEKYPHVVETTRINYEYVTKAASVLSDTVIWQFWKVKPPKDWDKRLDMWKGLISKHCALIDWNQILR